MKLKWLVGVSICIGAVVLFLNSRNKTAALTTADTAAQTEQVEVQAQAQGDVAPESTAGQGESVSSGGEVAEQAEPASNGTVTSSSANLAKAVQAESAPPVIELTAGNFESFVLKCFQGEPCELSEDPMKLYEELKISGNRQAADHLISFLRSKLNDAKLKGLYKEPLRQMINDFYPPEERQFQQAAYYNYMGDLRKSLDLYLDLEKKAAHNPSLRPAPKLNIANTLYDLGHFTEALPYYQAALKEYNSGQQEVLIPSTNEMVRIIEGRIEDIQGKLAL